MAHGGKEFRLGPVGGLRVLGHGVQPLIHPLHEEEVIQEEKQQPPDDDADQQPVFQIDPEVFPRHQAQQDPTPGGGHRGIGEDAFPPLGIQHGQASAGSGKPCPQVLQPFGVHPVAGTVEVKEVGLQEGVALDDVIPLHIHQGKFRVFEHLPGENPFLGQILHRNHPEQKRFPLSAALIVPDRQPVAEGQGLLPVHRIGERPGNIHGFPQRGDPGNILQQIHPRIGDRIVGSILDGRPRGKAIQRFQIHQMGEGVRDHLGVPDKGSSLRQGEVPLHDVLGPDIADLLLSQEVVLRHPLHGFRGVLKMEHLAAMGLPLFQGGIRHNENHHDSHDDDVHQQDPGFFHFPPHLSHIPRDRGRSVFAIFPIICKGRSARKPESGGIPFPGSRFPGGGSGPSGPGGESMVEFGGGLCYISHGSGQIRKGRGERK